MLIAEIHGKRLPEAEGQEDWLTSAVFGHLRHVRPGPFWWALLAAAHTAGPNSGTLQQELERAGVDVSTFDRVKITFWPRTERYGEPDLLLRFSGPQPPAVLLLVEVKLNSSKSGVGKDDQLAMYLRLLENSPAIRRWSSEEDCRYLVYLTRSFAQKEIEESLKEFGPGGRSRLFGLEWRDVLEAAEEEENGEPLLHEVARFLKGRGFAPFNGFHSKFSSSFVCDGCFYKAQYFKLLEGYTLTSGKEQGRFYGR